MLSKYRCLLLILYWSIVYVDCAKEPKKKPKCEITTPYNSAYISAYLRHFTAGRGCSTNNTSPSKQAVHVVNLDVKQQLADGKRSKIHLRIEPLTTELNGYNYYGRPLVFVLISNKPVKWKVEFADIGSAKIKHLFVVPSHSSIRFKKSVIKVRGRKMPIKENINKTDLVNWARRRFKAVTTYSEVEGTSIFFRVGTEAESGRNCDLNDLSETKFVMTSYKDYQTITGCTTQGRRHFLSKPVYIIELQQAPQPSTSEAQIDLEITSFNNEALTKDFYLILKSPNHIKWKIRSRKIQGWIDIVTDAEADLKDIRMQTVASRQEIMTNLTGDKLIEWAEKYIAAVETYISIKVANQIKLILPSNGVEKTKKERNQLFDSNDMKVNLHKIIQTQCADGKMTIYIPNYLLQEWALVKQQITLLDKSCGAEQNNTHIILQTSLTGCNTKYIQIDDNYVYSNAIVIHAASVTDNLLEDLGSGWMDPTEMSGSGTNDDSPATYVDDEDYQSRKVEIDVQCEQTIAPPSRKPDTSIVTDNTDYKLELFASEFFANPLKTASSSPVPIAVDTRVYIQASIISDIPLKVEVENCWLSPSDSKASKSLIENGEQLIINGCAYDESLHWNNFNPGGSANKHYRHLDPYSRFSFPLRDYFNGQDTYLYCELSQCQMHVLDSSIDIPQCSTSPREHCKQHLPGELSRAANTHNTAYTKILVIGPIAITGIPLSSGDNSGYKTDGATSSTESNNNQPQQSVIIEGLDSETVVGIAFAAFAIGILLTGTLWFIHTHTGPAKHVLSSHGSTETTGEITPNTQLPMSA
ncbi:hypothetical protein SNE40_001013 [Patella caerulea]|uniref:ZP domain-containing protein n=1 Tax=Patella caerulea TaxID=87958 RepID=A0AAN8QAQ1_PATCE